MNSPVERVHGAVAYVGRVSASILGSGSAEAAGLDAVYFVGQGDFVRSPARGADLAIPVHHLRTLLRSSGEPRGRWWRFSGLRGASRIRLSIHLTRCSLWAEDVGMPADLKGADLNVEIPQYGIIDVSTSPPH